MNILGHPYVAFKVMGRMNPYLATGSCLPDLVPFVPDSVFSFEEIHESPDKFLKFLDKKYPYARDLALGMMSHSVKYGADKFNRDIEEWLISDNKKFENELFLKIVDCSGVSLGVARRARLHNYLWSGVDVYLLKNESRFVQSLVKIHQKVDGQEIANLLAECFKKDKGEVKRMVDYLLEPMRFEFLATLPGLVKIWKKALAGLPEKDKVNEAKTARLFEEIYQQFENQWEAILKTVVRNVRIKMESFLNFRFN